MSANGTPKTLVTKLAEVMAAVERVPKRGRNDFHGYDYATEADIAGVIRKELADRKVMLIPSVESADRVPVGDKGSVLTTLAMSFTFLDGESGEELTRKWAGAGTDKEDKGLYKAMTGGEKYFLLKTFLMPTGDDPEREDAPPKKERAERPKAAPATAPEPSGALRIVAVHTQKGTSAKTGKAWTRFDVEFSDGRKASTFDLALAGRAEKMCDAKVAVTPAIETNGRNTNLVGLESDGDIPHDVNADPPFEYEGVAAKGVSPLATAGRRVETVPASALDAPDDDAPEERNRVRFQGGIARGLKRHNFTTDERDALSRDFLGGQLFNAKDTDLKKLRALYLAMGDEQGVKDWREQRRTQTEVPF